MPAATSLTGSATQYGQGALLAQFPSEPMMIWPISNRVNSPSNDDETLLDEVALERANDLLDSYK
jgi:hypothetical protein